MKNHDAENLDSFAVVKSAPAAFAGATSGARGDKDGANASLTIYTVTGDVAVRIFGVCTATLVGSGKLEVGVTGNTAKLIAQVADATDIAANDAWVDGTVNDVRAVLLGDVTATTIITNGSDIIETSSVADITSGQIYYVCFWKPLTSGSTLVAA